MLSNKNRIILFLLVLIISNNLRAEAQLADLPFMIVDAASWSLYQWLKQNIYKIFIASALMSLTFYLVNYLDKNNAGMKSSPIVLRWILVLKNVILIFTFFSAIMFGVLNIAYVKKNAEIKQRCDTEELEKCRPELAAKLAAEEAALEGTENVSAIKIPSEEIIAERTWKRFAPNQKPWPKHTSAMDLPEGERSGDRTIAIMNNTKSPLYVKLIYKTGDSRHWYVSANGSMVFEQVPAGDYIIHVLHLGRELAVKSYEFSFAQEENDFKKRHLEFSVYPNLDVGNWYPIKLEDF